MKKGTRYLVRLAYVTLGGGDQDDGLAYLTEVVRAYTRLEAAAQVAENHRHLRAIHAEVFEPVEVFDVKLRVAARTP